MYENRADTGYRNVWRLILQKSRPPHIFFNNSKKYPGSGALTSKYSPVEGCVTPSTIACSTCPCIPRISCIQEGSFPLP